MKMRIHWTHAGTECAHAFVVAEDSDIEHVRTRSLCGGVPLAPEGAHAVHIDCVACEHACGFPGPHSRRTKNAAEEALDEIAKLCGYTEEWDYPAQVVRDVRDRLDALRGNATPTPLSLVTEKATP